MTTVPRPASAAPRTEVDEPRPDAVAQDGRHPRPLLVRRHWADLCGSWDFAAAAEDSAPEAVVFDRTITVPFPPESPASGVGDTGFTPCVWYRRTVSADDLAGAGFGAHRPRVLLHFGAVDHRADVWLGGRYLGRHEGGQTPFSFDVSELVRVGSGPWELVVRAVDDPYDVEQPRGKQDWREQPHGIWYHRTTGIWQPVWLEAVPATYVTDLVVVPQLAEAALDVTVELNRRPADPVSLTVAVGHAGEQLGWVRVRGGGRTLRARVPLERAGGAPLDELLWWPADPHLLGVDVELRAGDATDVLASYTGLRSVAVQRRTFLLNDRPHFVRSVLEQGYWPESHLAAPSAGALRREVELIKQLGFNAVRVHQKAEDPRFLYWADRLGLMVWAETGNAYAHSTRAVELLVAEWTAIVRRYRSHPSVVTWVPVNESWGVEQGAHRADQRHYARALASLTRALDPTRPVVSNDGWEHVDSDIWTVHDYTQDARVLRERYASAERMPELLDRFLPAGRRVRLDDAPDRGQPFMLTEFGGVSWQSGDTPDAWGYSVAADADTYRERLTALFAAVDRAPGLAGFCYTQLTDTGQETNGLLRADRTPKLPLPVLRAIVDPGSA